MISQGRRGVFIIKISTLPLRLKQGSQFSSSKILFCGVAQSLIFQVFLLLLGVQN